MAQASEEAQESWRKRYLPTRKRWLVSWALLAILIVAFLAAWLSRERIADSVITDLLTEYDLPATYDIESISPDRQVLTNLVVGDPERPDLTVERIEVFLRYRLGTPALGRVEVTRARLYGSYRDGQLSFGSLDPILSAESDEPPGLPDLDLKLVDGRALIETGYGPVGIKAEGEGEIDDGFVGIVAVNAPQLSAQGCTIQAATLYGALRVASGEPQFDGPLRIGQLDCPANNLRMADLAVELDASVSDTLDGISAEFDGGAGGSRALGYSVRRIELGGEAAWRERRAIGDYRIALSGLSGGEIAAQSLSAEGSFQSAGNFQRVELDSAIDGEGVRIGSDVDAMLAGFADTASGTLAEPLLARLRRGLASELPRSSLSAELAWRKTGEVSVLDVPAANLRGASGTNILSLARVQLTQTGSAPPRFFGNFATGGQDLPQITGRMERAPSGNLALRMAMPEFSAADARLALPELVLAQGPGGAIGFSGRAQASGALPGGFARGLEVPLSGRWSPNGSLEVWRRCTDIRFDRLQLAQLELDGRRLTLCPPRNAAILRSDGAGLRIAAGAPALDLSGNLAGTPVAVSSGPIGFAWPGVMNARSLDISLGPAETALGMRIANLDARLGDEIAGSFDDADIRLEPVPMNLLDASGTWSYSSAGVLAVRDAAFTLQDRETPQRFEPLVARDASLTMEDNLITAFAVMREPSTDRTITSADIRHDLATNRGHADLAVRGLTFDEALQPDDLSYLAAGVVALVDGTVTGTGRIDWNGSDVTSSGSLSSDGIDFAAAFGPVKGASGTIEFTDLLSLTTAPDQRIRIGSINPGVEVLDGEITFALRDGQLLSVQGASWPFMGGTLTLKGTDLNFGVAEQRRYVFEITGLEASQFVQQMELANLSATGTFDGTVPIVFDEMGNGRIEGGSLVSRPPGGNVSYIGELTYEDLTPIANFAFEALRSLDYRQMTIGMDGNLTGEIVTKVRFDQVTQGEGANSNFITRRIARLPLEFRVNISAPFYQLITSLKAMYDPAYVRDPRELGLIGGNGAPLQREVNPPPDAIRPTDIIPDEPPIQQQESETMP